MGAVQGRLVQSAIATQTALGAPAAAPAYTVGLTGGKVYDIELEEAELDTTWSDRITAGYDRTQAVPIADQSLIALPKTVGALLMQGLGARSTTGAGPYVHTFTPGTSLPYVTMWGKFGSGDSARLTDAKIDSLEFEWEKTGALKVKAKWIGCGLDPSIAFPTVGTTAEMVASGVLKGNGGTFTIDGTYARVIGGSIKISNAIEPIVPSDTVNPADVFEGKVSVEFSLKIKPTDLTYWRKVVTGAVGGTTIAPGVLLGTADLKFLGPASSTLEFLTGTNAVAWSTNMPDANPSGGAAELTITGRLVDLASGVPLSVILSNSVASY